MYGVAPPPGLGDDRLELWQENDAPVRVFKWMATQWSVGTSGHKISLRYEALPFALRMCQVPREDWPGVVDGVRVLEEEALRLWGEK